MEFNSFKHVTYIMYRVLVIPSYLTNIEFTTTSDATRYIHNFSPRRGLARIGNFAKLVIKLLENLLTVFITPEMKSFSQDPKEKHALFN